VKPLAAEAGVRSERIDEASSTHTTEQKGQAKKPLREVDLPGADQVSAEPVSVRRRRAKGGVAAGCSARPDPAAVIAAELADVGSKLRLLPDELGDELLLQLVHWPALRGAAIRAALARGLANPRWAEKSRERYLSWRPTPAPEDVQLLKRLIEKDKTAGEAIVGAELAHGMEVVGSLANAHDAWCEILLLSQVLTRIPGAARHLPTPVLERFMDLCARNAELTVYLNDNALDTLQYSVYAAKAIAQETGLSADAVIQTVARLAPHLPIGLDLDDSSRERAQRYTEWKLSRTVLEVAAETGTQLERSLVAKLVDELSAIAEKGAPTEIDHEIVQLAKVAMAFPDREIGRGWIARLREAVHTGLGLAPMPSIDSYRGFEESTRFSILFPELPTPPPWTPAPEEKKAEAHRPLLGPKDRIEALELLMKSASSYDFKDAGGDQAVLALGDQSEAIRRFAGRTWTDFFSKVSRFGLISAIVGAFESAERLTGRPTNSGSNALGPRPRGAERARAALYAIVETSMREVPEKWHGALSSVHSSWLPREHAAAWLTELLPQTSVSQPKQWIRCLERLADLGVELEESAVESARSSLESQANSNMARFEAFARAGS
jgi:hypothetical protein